MKNFWEFNNIEKKSYVEEIVKDHDTVNSLSNDVYVVEDIVIKNKLDINSRKSLNEINFLSSNNFKYEVVDNFLILDRLDGANVTKEDIKNQKILENIVKAIKDFKKFNDKGVEKYDLFIKLSNSEKEILSILSYLNIEHKHYYDSLYLSKEEKEDVLSHSDLNDNNILINGMDITLIDFEEVTMGNKYHDFTSFISNWEVNNEGIEFICHLSGLVKKSIIDLSIVWSARYYIWNEKQYSKTNDQKYKDKMKFFESRMKYLNKIK